MTKALPVHGVDISHWQAGKLDFNAAKRAGVKWVYHKATEGTHYKDPRYTERRRQVEAAGLPFGAYHFARPGRDDAKAEARWFIDYAKPKKGDLRPVLDLETLEHLSGMPLVRWADEFCAEVERLTGAVPIVYTPYELSKELQAKALMWRPRYNNSNIPPKLRYDIWQFSNGVYGKPNSIAGLGNVDLNYMRPGLTVEEMVIGGKAKPKLEPKKSIKAIAREVIDGKWGNGKERTKRLKAAGYNAKKVQAKVNDLLSPPKKTVTQVAREVIDGKWGNGKQRVRRLRKAGYNPDKVQQKVNALLAPKPKPKPKPEPTGKPAVLKFAHASLQFSDSNKQHTHDIEKIFSRGYDVITGTEARPSAGNTASELKRCAKKYGYRLSLKKRYDTWVAIKSTLIVGKWKTGARFSLWRSSKVSPKPPGRWGDKGVVWASWDMGPTYGQFAVGAVHYHTRGGAGAQKVPFDKKYAEDIAIWAKNKGKGARLAFIGGDFNLNDKKQDVFYGHPLTTCWDELGKWPNTGHGPIDALASYDRDGRVKCVRARALNDKQLFLHTDHFLIEADYEIQPLP